MCSESGRPAMASGTLNQAGISAARMPLVVRTTTRDWRERREGIIGNFGRALEMTDTGWICRRFGIPTSPTSAISFSSSLNRRACPLAVLACAAPDWGLGERELPRPPRPRAGQDSWPRSAGRPAARGWLRHDTVRRYAHT